MSVNLSLLAGAGWQFFTDDGVPLAGGLLYTYAAGTTTPQTTYTSSLGTTSNANPIVLDSAGRVPNQVWLTTGSSYKFVLQNSVATQIWSQDNILGGADIADVYTTLAASSGSSLVGFIQSGSGAVATTVQTKLRQTEAKPVATLLNMATVPATDYYGLLFNADNASNQPIVWGAIAGEIKNATANAEEGAMHFLIQESNGANPQLEVVGTIDHNGSFIWGPGGYPFQHAVAGQQLPADVAAGSPALYSERLSSQENDVAFSDARPFAVRNLSTATDATYTAGMGFTSVSEADKEYSLGVLRFGWAQRTLADERTKASLALVYNGIEVTGPIWEMSQRDTSKESYLGAVPGMRAVKPFTISKTANYTVERTDSGAVLTNTGAKGSITFTLPAPQLVGESFNPRFHTGITLISGTNAGAYKWLAADASNPGAFYLVTTAGGDPGFSLPTTLLQTGSTVTYSALGAIADNRWGYGDDDALGFNTIYVRLGGIDPDVISNNLYVTYPMRVIVENVGLDSLIFTGAANGLRQADSNGLIGTTMDCYSYILSTTAKGWRCVVSGTWS